MLTKWQFWLIAVLLALATTVTTAVTENTLFLWIGGMILFFMVNARIREEIADNYYVNAAYTTLTACVLTVPQIFYGGTVGGWVLFAIAVAYQLLAHFTNLDYTLDHTVGRDISRNWRSETKTDVEKAYGHLVLAQGNWAAIVLTSIAFLAGAFVIAFLASTYSLFFLLLIPAYTFLWNTFSLIHILIIGIPVPTGYSSHEKIDNLAKGYWFLIWAVLKVVIAVVSAPFAFIAYIVGAIGKFCAKVKGGGSGELSKFFWICTGVLGIYLILSMFGAADFMERIFGGYSGFDLNISRFLFPVTDYFIHLELDVSFLIDLLLLIPKLLGLLLCVIVDLVLLLVVCLLWLLINALLALLYLILVLCFEIVLPVGLAAGAVTFLVLYLLDSDRDFIDWFRAVLFSVLPIGAIVFYFLLAYEVIKLF